MGSKFYVLDTCVWINCLEEHRGLLWNLIRLGQLGLVDFAVPSLVADEFRAGLGKQTRSLKADCEAGLKSLRRYVEVYEPGPFGDQTLVQAVDRLERAVKAGPGDPLEGWVHRVFESTEVTPIPWLKSNYLLVGKLASHGLKPFDEKGKGVGDARILSSVCTFASKNPESEVHFTTLNKADFSHPDEANRPHPDLTGLFHPESNIHYRYGIRPLVDLVEARKGDGSWDAAEEAEVEAQWDDSLCSRCHGPVLIEQMTCLACGENHWGGSDHEYYELTPRGDGYLVDLSGSRVSCGECGRKTFDVELESVCSYCQHVCAKD